MSLLRPIFIAPVVMALTILPSVGAPAASTAKDCLAPATFLTALTSAGDWIVQRSPQHAPDAKVTGIVFRESGMIDVAVFERGCLAAVVFVAKAPPDIQV